MKRLICLLSLACLVLALAGCAPEEFDVKLRLDQLSWEGDAIAVEGHDFTGVLLPDAQYRLPQSLLVEIDREELEPDDYEYDPASGELKIPGNRIVGKVEIRAEGEQLAFGVSVDSLAGLVLKDTQIISGQEYRTTLTPDALYQLPHAVSVQVNGEPLGSKDYTYDPESGELVITGGVTGDVVITAEANPVVFPLDTTELLSVKLVCDGTENPTKVAPAYGLQGVLACVEGNDLPEAVEVLVDGVALATSSYTYDPATGELTIPGEALTAAVQIKACAVPQIAGNWRTSVDLTDALNAYIAEKEPSYAAYFKFKDLTLGLTLELGRDSFGKAYADEASFDALVAKAKKQMVSGMKRMLQDLLSQQGINMDIDVYLELAGIDLEQMLDDSLDLDSMKSSMLSSGAYKVEGNKLYMANPNGTYTEGEYTVYSFNGDILVFESTTGSGLLSSNILPLTFNRIPE